MCTIRQECCVKKDPEATSWVQQKVHCDRLAMSALGKKKKNNDMREAKHFTPLSFIFNIVPAN